MAEHQARLGRITQTIAADASGHHRGEAFVCDKGRVMCMEKSFLGAGVSNYEINWFTPEFFEERNRRYVKKS